MNIAANAKIGYATLTDAPFIAQCQLDMALETEQLKLDKALVTKGVEAVFADPAKGFYIVVEKGNSPIACLMVTLEWSDWRNAWVWWIQSVYVKPEMRKAGIFGMMYEYIKDRVKENSNVSGIRLYVDKTNSRAQDVYRKVGMNGDHYSTFEWMK